ncbi:MAG: hypothetical protein VKM98_04735 [Cyanobacteriota bacterium]|nr:hypothetical protein [Cyanobacteriota bacterium]
MSSDGLIASLEAISRQRPDRVLRLRGTVAAAAAPAEAFELLIFKGFSSSTTHATDMDPDQPVLPADVVIEDAELLAAPLNPADPQLLAGPWPVSDFLDPQRW